MDKKTLCDLELNGKKVLVRVDYNVPMDAEGNITDDTRMTASLDTLHYLLEQGAAVILMAHLGRPKGEVNKKYSLEPVAAHLSKLLDMPVAFAHDCIGAEAEKMAAALKPGEVLMLENLRFHKEEEKNDLGFAEKLASLADCYVNDGFGVSHRAHASVEGVTHFLPAAAGFLLEKEIKFIGRAVTNPLHPYAAIIGGAKVSDKIGVIENLLDKVDVLLIGGGMANTFLAAQGYKMGKSLVEEDKLDLARSLLEKAAKNNVKMLLPVDLVMASAFAADADIKIERVDSLTQDYMALDIGPESRLQYEAALQGAKMIVWNGPMGVFEMDVFAHGTEAVAEAVAKSKAISIVGGGDSVAAIEKTGLASKISHLISQMKEKRSFRHISRQELKNAVPAFCRRRSFLHFRLANLGVGSDQEGQRIRIRFRTLIAVFRGPRFVISDLIGIGSAWSQIGDDRFVYIISGRGFGRSAFRIKALGFSG